MALDYQNPFDPPIELVPLTLTLDSRSFGDLSGVDRERAEFLCELCRTKAIDALWSWDGNPIDHHIPQTELRPLKNNDRAVGRLDEPPECFIGGVPAWDQFDRWADQNGYEKEEREWFVYYGSLAHFSDRSGRHFLVTANERLLRETRGDKGWFRAGRHRIISIADALFLSGLAMKAQREVFYEAPHPGYSVYAFSHQIYEWLAMDLIQPSRRLFDCVRLPGEDLQNFYRTEREALVESVFGRVADILRSRDRIALADARQQDEGALNDMRYDLSSMIGSAAGLFDAISVLAQTAFNLGSIPPQRVGLHRDDFRSALRGAGGRPLADAAGRIGPLLNLVWGLRNPLFHREGLSAYTLHHIGAERESRITLSGGQAGRLKELCGHRAESPKEWGLHDSATKDIDPSVEPFAFGHRFALTTIKATDELVLAFAEARDAKPLDLVWTDEQVRMLKRFRWLSGVPDHL